MWVNWLPSQVRAPGVTGGLSLLRQPGEEVSVWFCCQRFQASFNASSAETRLLRELRPVAAVTWTSCRAAGGGGRASPPGSPGLSTPIFLRTPTHPGKRGMSQKWEKRVQSGPVPGQRVRTMDGLAAERGGALLLALRVGGGRGAWEGGAACSETPLLPFT